MEEGLKCQIRPLIEYQCLTFLQFCVLGVGIVLFVLFCFQ